MTSVWKTHSQCRRHCSTTAATPHSTFTNVCRRSDRRAGRGVDTPSCRRLRSASAASWPSERHCSTTAVWRHCSLTLFAIEAAYRHSSFRTEEGSYCLYSRWDFDAGRLWECRLGITVHGYPSNPLYLVEQLIYHSIIFVISTCLGTVTIAAFPQCIVLSFAVGRQADAMISCTETSALYLHHCTHSSSKGVLRVSLCGGRSAASATTLLVHLG